ncbi:MAG: anthranilate phosphoribosyltransferase family protein [Phormidesmis sp.]
MSTPSDTTIQQFRDLLKQVGSGTHTSKSLSRQESAIATELMLREQATPAQIGAFMIAQRIKRPTPTELAGILDTYDNLGPKLTEINGEYPVTVFCNPYDGRSRTAPINPLTALILAAANCPVVIPGGDRMPTKMGLPLVEIWQALGLKIDQISLHQAQQILASTGIGFIYQPSHFPLAEAMVPYRHQIGKRPTLATVEIMWSPYTGKSNLVSGYVHPPTEERTQAAFTQRGIPFFTTVKGLEGSCDISRARTAILGLNELKSGELHTERLLLHPRDFDFDGADPEFLPLNELIEQYWAVLEGKESEIGRSAIWNSGFYLWRVGRVESLKTGFELARSLLQSGTAQAKLQSTKLAIDQL